jgi:deoxyribodipyrimidine photolyase-related protein
MKKNFSVLRLIFGDQLNMQHSWFATTDDEILYAIMEVRTETDYVCHHIQKICAFFAAMENFAADLHNLGHKVIYLKLDDKDNTQSFSANCDMLIEKYGVTQFQYQMPDEFRLDLEITNFCNQLKIKYKVFDTAHFYTTREELGAFFRGKKGLLMENFYREMRKKHNILMDGKNPVGGQWNFDEANRKKLPRQHLVSPPLLFDNKVTEQYQRITIAGLKTIGSINHVHFPWPINRHQSLKLLHHFCSNCLALFGTFEDAMHTDEWSLYHSRLSFSLNTKMLTPHEVVQSAITEWQTSNKNISLNQVEGFIRQIIGWREYMRGIYWLKMPDFQNLNFFDHNTNLPGWYWTGETKMNCLKRSIKQSLEHAYAHHIQRLMITGNFALLAGVHPDEVDKWYLGIYIDAIQWVEITNTRGMSQYADGGIIGSKPYTGSANYIHKMSNYCEGCYYDRSKRIGDRACPFNSLYWSFHERHRARLEKNPRLSMVYHLWDKIESNERDRILSQASNYLSHLEEL